MGLVSGGLMRVIPQAWLGGVLAIVAVSAVFNLTLLILFGFADTVAAWRGLLH
ncbi:hypothetical protein AADZ90_014060 [Aestuariibius sp. 2305UL40-4]|uniref:hypothetical protein n=1 Tax=Aestuariibius violaceus TaxID=3234132 RepID=UPI00346F1774